MKKFLTVLLVIAVMFTFSFGSAFALPSDTTDVEYAGVEAAKAEALDTIEDYAKLSDYTAEGQAILTLAQSAAKTELAADTTTTISAVKAIVSEYKELVDNMTAYLRANVTLKEAADKALAQVGDYNLGSYNATTKAWEKQEASVYGVLFAAGYIYENTAATGYAQDKAALEAEYVAFKAVIDKAYLGVGTVAEIEAATDKLIKAANDFGEKYFAEGVGGVPQSAINDLVKKIEAKADACKVNTTTHSAAVVAEFNAEIKAGIAAAKAVQTWDEYQDVYEKYLGYTTVKAAAVSGTNDVVIYRKATSVFEALKARTLDVEAQMAAAADALAAIGAYDYKDIVEGDWDAAESYLGTLEDAAEGDVASIKAVGLNTVKATTSAAKVEAAVDVVVAAYNKYVALAQVKAAAQDDLEAYYNTLVGKNSYTKEGQKTELELLLSAGKTVIAAAANEVKAVEAYYDYEDLMDAVKTDAEIANEANIEAYNKSVDAFIASTIKAMEDADKDFFVTADEYVMINAIAQYYKDQNEGQWTSIGDAKKEALKTVIEKKAYKKAMSTIAALVEPDFDTTAYSSVNKAKIGVIKAEFNAAKVAATTWTEYFAAIEVAEDAIDALQTAKKEAYIAAVAKAVTAIDAIGTVEDTKEFRAELKAAAAAVDAVETVAEDDPYEVAKFIVNNPTVTNAAKYFEASYDYAYLLYLAAQSDSSTTTVKSVQDFYKIAADMLTLTKYYDDAANKEIAQIITDAYAAIKAAGSSADKAAAAEAAIAALEAVKEKVDTTAYNEALADTKAEAAKYFNKYYGATFTSDATTHLQLAYDIMNFQNEFATVEAQIEAVEALKITAGSTAKKGSITVKWTVKGDTSYIDGYQVWKSTKKNSGFKKITAKTTKQQITNTKGLKAGTRYYYKVRAFQVIDGKYYYSDWSNKAYRKAK